jgi:type III pantothenate kinase
MFLALDIGNTNITVGLFNIQNGKILPGALRVWRMSTLKGQTCDEYATMLMDMFFYSGFDIKKIASVGIASVVPSLNFVFEDLVMRYFGREAFFVNNVNSGGIVFAVENPQKIGADRIANAVAAYSMYGCNCIVIDTGTATTFDCVDEQGRYIGGAIAPGLAISAQSLYLKTSQLPQVEIKKILKSIGTTTVECIQSGLYFGYIGLIKELIKRMKEEMEVKHVIATGGLAGLILGELKEVETIVPDLTLEGIRIIRQTSTNKNK